MVVAAQFSSPAYVGNWPLHDSLKKLWKDFEEGIAILAVVWQSFSDTFWWDQENETVSPVLER